MTGFGLAAAECRLEAREAVYRQADPEVEPADHLLTVYSMTAHHPRAA